MKNGTGASSQKQQADVVDDGAQRQTGQRRKQHGQQRPFGALRFAGDRQHRGAAGEMEQREDQHADGGDRRPAVGAEDHAQLAQRRVIDHAAAGHVNHDDDRQQNLIGGKREQKRQQDRAVETEKGGERSQKIRAGGNQADAADVAVGEQVDDDARRRGDRHGPAQHKERSGKNRADDHSSDLGTAIRRQFEGKAGRLPAQHGFREQARAEKRGGDAENEQTGQQQRRQQRARPTGADAHKEDRPDRDHRGEYATIQKASLRRILRLLTLPTSR